MKNFLQLISLLLPWKMRRAFLEQQFRFQIHPTARIGLAWILPSRLIMEENTGIGHFTVARNLNLFISHTIDIAQNRQVSRPISVGDYCFVGSNSVLLGGSSLPDYCVLGAKSLLNKAHAQTHRLYGGVPARELSVLSPDCGYFNRRQGFVI